jgi:hypothetical protein
MIAVPKTKHDDRSMAGTPPQISQPYGLLVHCPAEEFADFISKLLGKPQIASGGFQGPFRITLDSVDNFYHLIQQRVHEQNKGSLVQFAVSVQYDDGTSVEVTSIEYLKAYAEVRPVISTGIKLTWVYLVSFTNASAPERQQIDVSIDLKPRRRRIGIVHAVEGPEFFELGPTEYRSLSSISYRVSYTARTWGADIREFAKGSHTKPNYTGT